MLHSQLENLNNYENLHYGQTYMIWTLFSCAVTFKIRTTFFRNFVLICAYPDGFPGAVIELHHTFGEVNYAHVEIVFHNRFAWRDVLVVGNLTDSFIPFCQKTRTERCPIRTRDRRARESGISSLCRGLVSTLLVVFL